MMLLFAIGGLIAALGLGIIDLVTSYNGVKAVIPPGSDSLILKSIPWLFAVLAITFNGTSAHMFRHFKNGRFGGFANFILLVSWLNFLAYDWVTSFAGIVAEFGGSPLGSVDGVFSAFGELTLAQKYVAVAIAALASSGPFLASAFSDLVGEHLNAGDEDGPDWIRDRIRSPFHHPR